MNFLARLLRNWDKILLISFTTMEVQCQDTGGWKGISRVAVVLFKNSSHTGIVNDLLTKESDSEQKDFTHFLFPEIILPNGNWWLIASGADLHNVFIVFPYRHGNVNLCQFFHSNSINWLICCQSATCGLASNHLLEYFFNWFQFQYSYILFCASNGKGFRVVNTDQ